MVKKKFFQNFFFFYDEKELYRYPWVRPLTRISIYLPTFSMKLFFSHLQICLVHQQVLFFMTDLFILQRLAGAQLSLYLYAGRSKLGS